MDKRTECAVAVDLGASGGCLVAGYLEDGNLKMCELHRFENAFVHDGEHDVWPLQNLIHHIVKGLQNHSDLRIRSMGIDTWGVDYVLTDDQGLVLDKGYSYRDHRTAEVYKRSMAELGREKIYKKTGIQFLPFNTLYQLRAHVEQNPQVFQRAKHLLMLPDYFHYIFSAVFSNEFTNATTTQLMDRRAEQFDTELLSYAGVSQEIFPPMLRAGDIIGPMTDSMLDTIAADADVQIIAPGTHDTASAIAAFMGGDAVYISSGTWSLMGVETTDPVITEASRAYNFSNEGGVHRRNCLLKNIMGMWIIHCIRDEIEGSPSFEELMLAAQKTSPFRSIINPNDERFLNPKSMVAAVQSFTQETKQIIPQTTAELIRCVYDSLALQYNKVLGELEELTARSYEKINIIGGGSRNSFLNQLTANITGREVVAGPVETTARGNLVVQMIALNWLENLQQARNIIGNSAQLSSFYPATIEGRAEAIDRFEEINLNE